jgi:hypothetical protein
MTCLGNVWLTNSVPVFSIATNFSTLQIYCNVNIAMPGLTMLYFAQAWDSSLDFRYATFTGYPLAAGKRFYLDHSSITFPENGGVSAIPGQGSEAINFSVSR